MLQLKDGGLKAFNMMAGDGEVQDTQVDGPSPVEEEGPFAKIPASDAEFTDEDNIDDPKLEGQFADLPNAVFQGTQDPEAIEEEAFEGQPHIMNRLC